MDGKEGQFPSNFVEIMEGEGTGFKANFMSLSFSFFFACLIYIQGNKH